MEIIFIKHLEDKIRLKLRKQCLHDCLPWTDVVCSAQNWSQKASSGLIGCKIEESSNMTNQSQEQILSIIV